MIIKFWGTRGSIPVPGKETINFGGNTPCLQISEGDKFIIIDAGTGIRELGKELTNNHSCGQLHLLISHTHWDHIQGLPFFQPIYSDKCDLKIYADSKFGSSINRIFETQWDPNYFPVTSEIFQHKVSYTQLSSNEQNHINSFKIETINSHHSDGTLSFKILSNGKSIIYMTDNELFYDAKNLDPNEDKILELNKEQIEFAKNADVLIHDSMYKYDDYKPKIGWGHSNNRSVALFAKLANVKKLVLFHYDPDYNDDDVAQLEAETKQYLNELKSIVVSQAAYDGMELKV